MTEPPFPIQHGCRPRRWCGQCRANRDAGFPEAYKGNGTRRRERTGELAGSSKPNICPHLGEQVAGASRVLRVCNEGIAPKIHGRSLIVCCNAVNEGEWQLGKQCGPGCEGFPKAVKEGSAYAPVPPIIGPYFTTMPFARPALHSWEYITTARLMADTVALIPLLPPTIDLVIGCARSGLMPAAAIATALHVPLWTFAEATGLHRNGGGSRTSQQRRNGFAHALVVDDTAATGRQLKIVRQAIGNQFAMISTAVVYSTPEAASSVDHVAAILPGPHYLEWNWPNAGHGADCDYDFDGILCRDPSREEDDDGPLYDRFLATAEPLFLPRRSTIPSIVTARHEMHRTACMAWLERHGVRSKQLVMRDFHVSGDWHQAVGEWKGQHYRKSASTLFAESDPHQAEVIARVSGKPVLCPAAGKVFTSAPKRHDQGGYGYQTPAYGYKTPFESDGSAYSPIFPASLPIITPKIPIISVLYYHNGWAEQLLKGLRANGIDNEVIWVNHLPHNDVRPEYLDDGTTVVKNPAGPNAGGHGGGIDAGMDHARQRGNTHAIHLDTDCIVTGDGWLESLLRAAEDGAELAGPHVLPTGLIHPCVSIWKLDAIRHSFKVQPKVEIPDPEFFDHRGQVEWMARTAEMDPLTIGLFTTRWDCALLNAYEARRRGKAVQTNWDGIEHHWEGRSKTSP